MAGTITAGFMGQTIGIIPVLATQACGYLAGGVLVLVALRHEAPASQLPGSRTASKPTGCQPGIASSELAEHQI